MAGGAQRPLRFTNLLLRPLLTSMYRLLVTKSLSALKLEKFWIGYGFFFFFFFFLPAPLQTKYDVFLSFRGEDTRDAFTSHLHAALRRKNIDTYIDNRLERGDEIAPALLKQSRNRKLH
ncbi:Toll-Interleukin-Resistance domain-containing protein [Prunus dulcis]|uniref:Toll-Interleukin-Resistance domain-containing protein n=1 Tax=Prunus dulcis TaxID=3755 RepID=A0A4Y1RZW6_PRUDU|nr:Toll-Interleukin-Resistance domain-containing protein [Prunus dulcis]